MAVVMKQKDPRSDSWNPHAFRLGRMSTKTLNQLREHILVHLLPLATAEQAKCARGRLNLWLQAEPNYSTRKYQPAHSDPRLWRFCQRIDAGAALAQIYFATGNHGISWHRDASYAKPDAFIVNSGQVCLETKMPDGRLTSLELTGGEIIAFNCKLMHRAIPRSDDRIGIGV
jgi:hypothetical protein